jgi:glycosyltransferase involved in cell wall biosynthesis
MRPLSVVIIAFNEERNIPRCLASVQGVADDIVVLDSFSTDGTETLVRAAGARFVQHQFDGYIEQKNRAIGHAKHSFVLSLDADEALSEPLRQAVLAAKQGAADGYTMNRLTNYCGTWIKHGGWYPDKKLRLWDSRKGHWGGVNPHDRYILPPDARVEHLSGDLLHYSFYQRAEHLAQVERFSTIAAKAMHAKGRRGGVVMALFSAAVRFLNGYVLRGGFLDGPAGLAIARFSARAKWLKYTKLRALHKSSTWNR